MGASSINSSFAIPPVSGFSGAGKCRLVLLAVLAMVVSTSCVTQPARQREWPADMPSRAYFERIYDNDRTNSRVQSHDNYLNWVIRFYKGWELYQDGWQAVTRDVLLSVEDDAGRERVRSKLAVLGRRISGEWAKNSRDRVIRSRELSIWGQALTKAINRGEEEKLVNRINRDVEALLSEKLHPAEITLNRYYRTDNRSRDS